MHSTFAYQQQGFTSYQEDYGNKIDFACESQCVVLLETLGSMDYLYVEGQLQGN
ncbi:hypothetical protein KKH82_03060 [Patescibacteria group bacterium]|nr:hypothetical protein [Patescibacteria group bacterium]